jgi:sterol 3beta-glucosyltransferase
MASQDRERDRMGRRLSKKRKDPGKDVRAVSLDMPDRFKDGDDAHLDVTAPKRNNTMSMNQSIFSMIARAGQQSQTDLGTMQEIDSGDSEVEDTRKTPHHSLDGAARLSRLSSANDFQNPPAEGQDGNAEASRHRRALSENKLLRSLPKLKMTGRKEMRSEGQRVDQMSSSQFLPPRPSPDTDSVSPTEQSSKAKPKVTPGEEIHVEKIRSPGRSSTRGSTAGLNKKKEPVTLARRIKQIFEFEDIEEVISEYPCWLLQSILLQGYMYITQKHICFYAYIPKKHVSCPRTLLN